MSRPRPARPHQLFPVAAVRLAPCPLQVPFNTGGFRCSVNMYLQLCARPLSELSVPGSMPAGAAEGYLWPQSAGHYPQQQQYAPAGVWDSGRPFDSVPHGHVPGRDARATPFDRGYPPPALPPAQVQALAAVAAAAAAAAATAAPGGDGNGVPPAAKRQALQGAWPAYDPASGADDGDMHRMRHPGDAWVADSSAPAAEQPAAYAHVHLSSDGSHGGRHLYDRTAFQSSDLPSQVPEGPGPATEEEDRSNPRGDSMDVPPSTDFSELFESMFKE